MQFALEDWQQIALQQFRRYLEAEVAPLVEEYEDAYRMPPPQVIQRMHDFGLLGGLLPPEQGGQGLDYVTYCTLLRELSRVWALAAQHHQHLQPRAAHPRAARHAGAA